MKKKTKVLSFTSFETFMITEVILFIMAGMMSPFIALLWASIPCYLDFGIVFAILNIVTWIVM